MDMQNLVFRFVANKLNLNINENFFLELLPQNLSDQPFSLLKFNSQTFDSEFSNLKTYQFQLQNYSLTPINLKDNTILFSSLLKEQKRFNLNNDTVVQSVKLFDLSFNQIKYQSHHYFQSNIIFNLVIT